MHLMVMEALPPHLRERVAPLDSLNGELNGQARSIRHGKCGSANVCRGLGYPPPNKVHNTLLREVPGCLTPFGDTAAGHFLFQL